MSRVLVRAAVAAAFGAAAGALMLMLAYSSRAAFALEMDRDLPAFASGFHPLEREGERTFVWTSERAVVRLAGIDRRAEWTCTVRARGPRAAGQPTPSLTMSFDGAGSAVTALTNEFEDVALSIPARPDRAGLTLTMDVSPTFVPGGGDPRTLGAQIDWLRCAPSRRVLPPSEALTAVSVAVASFAVAVALSGGSLMLIGLTVIVAGAGLAVVLATGGGVFGDYPALARTIWIAAAAALVAIVSAPRVRGRAPVSGAALVAVCATLVLAALKLSALAHPAKSLVDALFQAHRLDWVVAGRYFFTQPLPDGVAFPYAIGLYVTAMPWASAVTDHVLLLRVVVIAADAVAGLLLYAMVVRGFNDRLAGLIAVVLFHVVPLPYIVVGNGNLTNAFAQSVAVMAIAAVALMPLKGEGWRRVDAIAVLAVLTALAFLSHVSTIMLLAAVLGMTVVAYLLFGGPALRRPAVTIMIATVLAALIAVGLYYRHFSDVFEQFASRVAATDSVGAAAPVAPAGAPAVLVRQLTWNERAADALEQTTTQIGWPVLAMALLGVLRLATQGWRRPVPLLLGAWAATWLILVFSGTLTRVDTQYQRYAAEFIGRINLASYPAFAMLAAIGAAVLLRMRPRFWSAIVAVVIAAAVAAGISMWRGWLG